MGNTQERRLEIQVATLEAQLATLRAQLATLRAKAEKARAAHLREPRRADRIDALLSEWIAAAQSDPTFGRVLQEPTPARLREAIAKAGEYSSRVLDAESRATVAEARAKAAERRSQMQCFYPGCTEEMTGATISPVPLVRCLTHAARAEEINNAATKIAKLVEALGMGTPFPVADVLTRLADATDHLLGEHSCDAHGYEGVTYARDAARKIAAALGEAGETIPAADTPQRFLCREHGLGVVADEDGCCAMCGGDCAIVAVIVALPDEEREDAAALAEAGETGT